MNRGIKVSRGCTNLMTAVRFCYGRRKRGMGVSPVLDCV